MRFYKKLYVSPALKKKKRQIVWKLKFGKVQPTLYLITLSPYDDMLEIYHNAFLRQPWLRKRNPYIAGFAESYPAAVALVQNMIMDAKEVTGSYDVKKLCLSQSSH